MQVPALACWNRRRAVPAMLVGMRMPVMRMRVCVMRVCVMRVGLPWRCGVGVCGVAHMAMSPRRHRGGGAEEAEQCQTAGKEQQKTQGRAFGEGTPL